MKIIASILRKNMKGQGNFTSDIHSGQLLGPDRSCRKVSQILSDISNNTSQPVLDAISSLVENNSAQDLAFLRGGSAELGVIPLKPVDKKSDSDFIGARCIWDSRWREELCVLYTKANHLAFYAPLTKKPSLVVGFEEIISVRKCNPTIGPLPGLLLLSIDTAWRCHYVAFLDEPQRDNFVKKMNDALFYAESQSNLTGKASEKRAGQAEEWESFKMSLETSLTGSVGKWASVSTGKKSKQKKPRRILNGRRMMFDLDPVTETPKVGSNRSNIQDQVATYAESLLRMSLSFSPGALNSKQSNFIEFLDEASRLRSLPMHEIDFSSKEAFCIFVNVYHCLLQHALLLAVDGLPDKVRRKYFCSLNVLQFFSISY